MSGGASAGQQKGSSRNSGSYQGETSSTMMPIIGEDWMNRYQGLGNTLGGTGITADQQGNVNALNSFMNNNAGAMNASTQTGLGDLKSLMPGMEAYSKAGYYSLADMSKNFGGEWATPEGVTPQAVTAQTGASFMDPYQKGYTNDVVDATLANFDKSADRGLSSYRMRAAQGGAFGDRAGLGEAQFMNDTDMNRAQTEATLRDQGFSRGMQGGMQDAGNALQASGMNASNKLSADTFNNNLTNNRQQFSVNQAMQGDQNRMQALRDMQNNILSQSGLQRNNILDQNSIQRNSILDQSAIQSGGIGNMMNYLGLGTETFGQQNDATASGSSESYGTNSSKSKGGGVSGGLIPGA